MLRKLLLLLALAGASSVLPVSADEVVRWVDEDGVTHFGNAQFAPSGEGEPVKLPPANGMDVPDTRGLKRRDAPTRMNMFVLDRPKFDNPRGWRGHDNRRIRAR